MINRILVLALVTGSIFLYQSPIFALFSKENPRSTDIVQCFTQEEQGKLPFLIASSLKEIYQEKTHFAFFIEGLKLAEQEKTYRYQESAEIQAYVGYVTQAALDVKITKNLASSVAYLRKQQDLEYAIPLINDKIYYKILKNGIEKGIEDNTTNKVKINFTIKDIEGNSLAGNDALSGPISCTLNELIPGMAYGMLGMRLGELREIYVHPEFAYGIFSSFGHGKALSIKVELLECSATDTAFQPCLIAIDLAKALHNYPDKTSLDELQKDHMFFCGKASWSFYKKKLPHLSLADILTVLQSGGPSTALSPQDKEILYKLQWLIYYNEGTL